jgi:tartrate-resistant acid phosphatase type 5
MNHKTLAGFIVMQLLVLLFGLSLICPVHTFAQKTRFAVIGDFGSTAQGASGTQGETQVADMVKSWNPSFIITVGDNNYKCGESSTIDENIGNYYCDFIYNPGATSGKVCTGKAADQKTNLFFPSLGNHDWYTPKAKPYVDYFTQLPGNRRYYDFVQGPVHFFALDSESTLACKNDGNEEEEEEPTSTKCKQTCAQEPHGTSANSKQAKWLRAALKASKSPWNIVFFHRPPYSCSGVAPWMRWPFKKWGVNAVLAGHHHVYERIVRTQHPHFPYFVNGVGGTKLTTCKKADIKKNLPANQFNAIHIQGDYGAMLVEASENEIVFQFYIVGGQQGQVKDTCTLRKTKKGQTLSCSQS